LRQKQVDLEESRRQVLDEAREQARKDLERVRSEIRRLRLTLLQEGGSSPVIKEVAAVVEALAEEMAPLDPVELPALPAAEPLQVGDTVYVVTLGQQGELLSLSGQEAEVRVGGFRLRTRPGSLEFRSRPQRDAAHEEVVVRRPQVESPGVELDLRGRRAEEVESLLGKYLDDAYLAGLPWVNIIHGKGMGVLKEVVRQFLAGYPLVSSFRPGALAEGGEGVTVAQLHRHSD
jgi:DNA mismatch repair protein MutS2